jgi:hypothetical protein
MAFLLRFYLVTLLEGRITDFAPELIPSRAFINELSGFGEFRFHFFDLHDIKFKSGQVHGVKQVKTSRLSGRISVGNVFAGFFQVIHTGQVLSKSNVGKGAV